MSNTYEEDNALELYDDTKLKARRLLMLDRAFTMLNANVSTEAISEHARQCIEFAKEVRIGMTEKRKQPRRPSILDENEE
jgi:hypothetical protein